MLSDKARNGARLLIGLVLAIIALASAVVYTIRADGPLTQESRCRPRFSPMCCRRRPSWSSPTSTLR